MAIGVSRLLPFFEPMNATAVEPLAAVVTCTMMVGLGVIDDRRGTSALAKLTAQIFIAGILILLGVQLAYFVLPGEGLAVLGTDEAVPLTILWVLAAANAINLVDGLDGLAAGMVAIAAATFFIYMVRGADLSESASVAALLSAITVGVCLGFLPWNFHPAKIFMGDTGSMLLGMLVAVATISGVGLNPFPPERGDVAVIALPLLVPLLVLAIPFLDVVLAIVRRTRKGVGIMHADKEHIYHRLMDGVDPALVDRIERTLGQVAGVDRVDSVRVRWVGHRLHAEAEIVSAPSLSLAEAHDIAETARHELLHAEPRLHQALLHTSPGTDGVDPHARVAHHATLPAPAPSG